MPKHTSLLCHFLSYEHFYTLANELDDVTNYTQSIICCQLFYDPASLF
jgi:hypothetical protein